MALPQHVNHHVCQDIKEAEAVAYALLTADGDLTQYPFKFNGLGDDEIRIKVLYASLCHTDCIFGRDKWGKLVKPCVLGHELIGTVSVLGKNAQGFKVGDRVGFSPQRYSCGECKSCRYAKEIYCDKAEWTYQHDSKQFGGYATHFQGHYRHYYKIPDGIPSEVAGPLFCAGATVFSPLKQHAEPGLNIAIIGIGGLGHLAVSYAAKFGMTVTAFTSTPEKSDFCYKLGAQYIKSSVDPKVLLEESGKYDIVFSTFCGDGDEIWNSHMNLTKKNGKFIVVGVPPNEQVKFSLMKIVVSGIQFIGSALASRNEFEEMLQFSALHKIFPICEQFKFEDFPKAFDKLENGKPMLRLVVNVHEWAKQNGFDK